MISIRWVGSTDLRDPWHLGGLARERSTIQRCGPASENHDWDNLRGLIEPIRGDFPYIVGAGSRKDNLACTNLARRTLDGESSW